MWIFNYIINTMFAAAKEITGLVLTPDMRLYSNEGKLVFSTEGKSDFDEYIPVGNADFLDSGAEETPSDTARRERSIAVLEEKGIPYIPRLRAAVMESEARLRVTGGGVRMGQRQRSCPSVCKRNKRVGGNPRGGAAGAG